MAKAKRFEDLEVWQAARELVRLVYRLTGTPAFARDGSLKGQLRRAAVSVMGNIAEGFERGGNNEFAHFLAMAKGSAGEVRSHAYVAADQRYLAAEEHRGLADKATDISRMLSGLMRHLRQSPMRGSRYKER